MGLFYFAAGLVVGVLIAGWLAARPKPPLELHLMIELDATKELRARIRPLKDAENNVIPWTAEPSLTIIDPDGDALDEGSVTAQPDEEGGVKVFIFNPGDAGATGKLVAEAATAHGAISKEIEFSLVAGAPVSELDIELTPA